MDKSIKRVNEIIEHHLRNIERYDGSDVMSVIVVGSLTNGSYTADSGSDIDLIHILSNNAPALSRDKILKIISKTEQETGSDIPISRCVYRFKDLFRPYPVNFELSLYYKDYIELPIEIMRMKDSGLTVWGNHILDQFDYPLREDVVACKILSSKWSKLEIDRGFTPISDE